jgi:hypothetical protein
MAQGSQSQSSYPPAPLPGLVAETPGSPPFTQGSQSSYPPPPPPGLVAEPPGSPPFTRSPISRTYVAPQRYRKYEDDDCSCPGPTAGCHGCKYPAKGRACNEKKRGNSKHYSYLVADWFGWPTDEERELCNSCKDDWNERVWSAQSNAVEAASCKDTKVAEAEDEHRVVQVLDRLTQIEERMDRLEKSFRDLIKCTET